MPDQIANESRLCSLRDGIDKLNTQKKTVRKTFLKKIKPINKLYLKKQLGEITETLYSFKKEPDIWPYAVEFQYKFYTWLEELQRNPNPNNTLTLPNDYPDELKQLIYGKAGDDLSNSFKDIIETSDIAKRFSLEKANISLTISQEQPAAEQTKPSQQVVEHPTIENLQADDNIVEAVTVVAVGSASSINNRSDESDHHEETKNSLQPPRSDVLKTLAKNKTNSSRGQDSSTVAAPLNANIPNNSKSQDRAVVNPSVNNIRILKGFLKKCQDKSSPRKTKELQNKLNEVNGLKAEKATLSKIQDLFLDALKILSGRTLCGNASAFFRRKDNSNNSYHKNSQSIIDTAEKLEVSQCEINKTILHASQDLKQPKDWISEAEEIDKDLNLNPKPNL